MRSSSPGFHALTTIDASEIAISVRPLVPNRNLVLAKVADIGVAFEKPEQLVNDRAQVKLFRRDQRESLAEIKPFLRAENGIGAGASAVGFEFSLVENKLEKPVILLHGKSVKWKTVLRQDEPEA